jgi:hypothetical protein
MALGKMPSEYEADKSLSRNSRGGLDLIDDGSGRLREKSRADFHTPDCQCHFCRKLSCIACYQIYGTTKIWRSLTGFGRHLQIMHPHLHTFQSSEAKARKLTRQLRSLKTAQEIKKLKRSGLRRVNLKRITNAELQRIDTWLKQQADLQREDKSADPMMLEAIRKADDKYLTKTIFEQATRALQSEIERGARLAVPVTSKRTTYFDPRVSLEILKVCYATGRGWSFIVHILLLYGLESFIDGLDEDGFSPPGYIPKVPKPETILAGTGNSIIDSILESRK